MQGSGTVSGQGRQFYISIYDAQHYRWINRQECDCRQAGKVYSSFCQIVQGEGSFETEGGTLHCGAGDLLYMPDGEHYKSIWRGNPHIEFLSLFFRFYAADSATDASGIDTLHLLPIDRQFMFQKVDPLSCFSKRQEMLAFLAQWNRNEEGRMEALSIAYRLLSEAYPHLRAKKKRTNLSILEPVILYMNQHPEENHKTAFFAEMCHISEARLYQLFAGIMKCSILEYRNHLRMYKAATLLKQTNLSIEEISEKIGYESAEYFRRIFKRYFHTTPTQYRTRNVII